MKSVTSVKSNEFLKNVSVKKFYAYFSEDFEELTKEDDPDIGIADGKKFNELNSIIKKKAEEDDCFQRIDIALIGNKVVVFIQDQWPGSYDIFPIFETHCSHATFKRLLRKETA